MIVCLCHGVSDRTVRMCVMEGASSVEDVGNACGAGTGCGACHEDIVRIAEGQPEAAVSAVSLRRRRLSSAA